VNIINFEIKKIDRIIKETLRCNICLQIFDEPVNMKNCLHKFCKKCIEQYNRRMYLFILFDFVNYQLIFEGYFLNSFKIFYDIITDLLYI